MERLITNLGSLDMNIRFCHFRSRTTEPNALSDGDLRVFGRYFRELLKLLHESFLGANLCICSFVFLSVYYKGLNQACITSFPNQTDQAVLGLFPHQFFDFLIELFCIEWFKFLYLFFIRCKVVRDEF